MKRPTPPADHEHHGVGTPDRLAWLGRLIGRSRLIVLVAVIGVLLVAFSLFLLGAIQALIGAFEAWAQFFAGDQSEFNKLTVRFLEIVTLMLKAVVFYLIGVGLYSLFIAPLNVAVSLGVETLHDLETKVVNVVVVILAVTFLEHFILWEDPWETLQFGAALAVTVAALVVFQILGHRVRETQQALEPHAQARAKHEMFEQDREQYEIHDDEVDALREQAAARDRDRDRSDSRADRRSEREPRERRRDDP